MQVGGMPGMERVPSSRPGLGVGRLRVHEGEIRAWGMESLHSPHDPAPQAPGIG